MKKRQYRILLTFLCLIGYTYLTAQTSQTLPEVDGKVIYENLRLEKQGSSIILSFDTRIAGKALNNRQSWKVMPELTGTNTNQTVFFPLPAY